jgi:hypothetical protein
MFSLAYMCQLIYIGPMFLIRNARSQYLTKKLQKMIEHLNLSGV